MLLNKITQSTFTFNFFRSSCILLFTVFSSLAYCIEESSLADPEDPEDRIQEWRNFNINTVNDYIIPIYKELNRSAQAMNTSINNLCSNPQNISGALTIARKDFHQTMDAWQFIQNIQFGPIQILMRNYTLQFWPDKKNHVSKHLAIMLETKDPKTLTDAEFNKASVSIKGLPAIERFLFEEDETKQLNAKSFHCQALMKIGAYTANSSKELVDEWQDMKNQFTNATQIDGYFEDDIEASTTLLKALIEPLEIIRDLKLLRPLGSEFGQQKMKRLESWRSQRSLRNIQINIESLSRFYTGLRNILGSRENTLINEKFNQILIQISIINSPIETSIETKIGFKEIKHLSDSLKTLHALLENAVSNQGIHLGFNSRDGD
ncbi:MAG: putative lipoprotein [Oleiphilaceae bacterium]|jgi:predicted lipoprotein